MTNIANFTPKKSQASPPPDASGSPLDTVLFDEELVADLIKAQAVACKQHRYDPRRQFKYL
jgi:hypothetical protein